MSGSVHAARARGDAMPVASRSGAIGRVSVVVPVYRSSRTLPALCARTAAVLDGMAIDWEMVLVDDASPDDTGRVAEAIAAADPRVRVLRNRCNLGQHRTTVVGIRQASGDTVVTIDDDLQQLPESIPLLLGALRDGREVAIARFASPAHAWWRRAGSALLARAMRMQRRTDGLAVTSFKALRRDATRRLLAAVPETGPFYFGTVLLHTTPVEHIVNVDVPHHPRAGGRSGYRTAALVRMALRALRAPGAGRSAPGRP